MTRTEIMEKYRAEFEKLYAADEAWENDDSKEDDYYNTLFAIEDKIGAKAARMLCGIIANMQCCK